MIEQLITIAGTAGAVLAVVLPLQLRTVSRLDRIESRLSHLEARLDVLEARMDALEARMDALEAGFERRDDRIDGLASSVSELGQRVARIEGILISTRETSDAAI